MAGIIPASISCTAVDVDHGGESAVEAVLGLLGEPVGNIPTKSPAHFHLWYRTEDALVGNRKWEIPGVGSGEILGSRGRCPFCCSLRRALLPVGMGSVPLDEAHALQLNADDTIRRVLELTLCPECTTEPQLPWGESHG